MNTGSKVPVSTAVVRGAALISLSQEKVKRFGATDVVDRIRRLAALLRTQRGVREVHAVWFERWENAARPGEGPPWTPYGAIVVAEAPDLGRLRAIFDGLFALVKDNKDLDQEMIEMSIVDDW